MPDRSAVNIRESAGRNAVIALVAVLIYAGFVNTIPTKLQFATVVTDLIVLVMILAAVVQALRRIDHVALPGWCIALLLLAVTYGALLVGGTEPLGTELTTIRNVVLYSFVAVFPAIRLQSRKSIDDVIRAAIYLTVPVAVFGILQSIAGSRLPGVLLAPRDAPVFGYYGTDIVRSNGLIGNSIVYATFLLLMLAVSGGYYLRTLESRFLLIGGLLAIGVFFTYSRAALVGALIVSLSTYVLDGFARRRAPSSLFKATLSAAASLALVMTIAPLHRAVEGSFIYQALFLSQNASVRGSNQGHLLDMQVGLGLFRAHPWSGNGIGSVSQYSTLAEYGSSITDGAFWARLAETGLVGIVAHAVVIATTLWALGAAAYRTQGRAALSVALLAYSIYEIAAAAFVNSAYYGKTPFVIYWLFFGVAMAEYRVERGRRAGVAPDRGEQHQRDRAGQGARVAH